MPARQRVSVRVIDREGDLWQRCSEDPSSFRLSVVGEVLTETELRRQYGPLSAFPDEEC